MRPPAADAPKAPLPDQLAEIVADFDGLTAPDRLQLLAEFGDELPDLSEIFVGITAEQVHECQSPIFLAVQVGTPPEHPVQVFFTAPAEATTTRGFAGILYAGLTGLPAQRVLAVPDDLPRQLGLSDAVSPLRLRGMTAMLSRIKTQVRAAVSDPAPR